MTRIARSRSVRMPITRISFRSEITGTEPTSWFFMIIAAVATLSLGTQHAGFVVIISLHVIWPPEFHTLHPFRPGHLIRQTGAGNVSGFPTMINPSYLLSAADRRNQR